MKASSGNALSEPSAANLIRREPMPTGHYKRVIHPRTPILPIGPSIAYVPLSRGLFALVDADDAVSIGRWNWYANRNYPPQRVETYYVSRKLTKDESDRSGVVQRLHNFLMRKQGLEVDHINRNPLDNRKSNLRFATRQEQSVNTNGHCDSASGHKNVWWDSQRLKWGVRVMRKGVSVDLGRFESIPLAVQARDAYLCPPKPVSA